MKGISAIIATILMLLITVSLAFMAFTWFSAVFTGVTTPVGNQTLTQTGRFAGDFSLESPSYGGAGTNYVVVRLRNTGAVDITMSGLSADIGGKATSIVDTGGISALTPGNTTLLKVSNASLTGSVCGKALTIFAAVGPEAGHATSVVC